MDNQAVNENKKSFWQNDKLLVCSMLSFYGLCIIGLIAGTFVWLGQRSREESANATATAIVRATEQAQYEFIDSFSNDTGHWVVGPENDEYMTGSRKISSGIYKWEIREVKQSFSYWSTFYAGHKIKDFDVYVDTKIIDAGPGDVCSGFVFRSSSNNWEDGAYAFTVCNNSTYNIYFYNQKDRDGIAFGKFSNSIKNNDWNRLEIKARGDYFTFIVNNEIIFETNDDRQQVGGLALLIYVKELDPASVWFDNFGFQSR